jgi:methionyl-tRNA formyltransferase
VSAVAQRAGTPLLRPERVGDADCVEALASQRPDVGVVVAYGQFIPRSVRELPQLGYLLNAHASLLPRHRGAAPIQHAILSGDATTGISVMRVEREMDAGAVALVRETPIEDDEDAGSLGERLGSLAADAIDDALDSIAAREVTWAPQDPARATLAPKISKDDLQLDFRNTADLLARRVRAFAPSPGAVTSLDDEPLRILAASVKPGGRGEPPGRVSRDANGRLRIATGEGFLVPTRVQRPGGRALAIDAFLRGRDVADGMLLGDS